MARHPTIPLPRQRSETEAQLMHADWAVSQGQTAQAIGLYRTAGSIAEQQGDLRTAQRAYDSLVRLEGDGSPARLALGQVQAALGNKARAAFTLDLAANEALQRGDVVQGLHAYQLAAEAEPCAARWLKLADWCQHLGKPQDAITHLDMGIGLLFAAKQHGEVITIAQQLLTLSPGHVPTLRRLIRSHFARDDMHRAVNAIQLLLAVRPADPDALERMAEAFANLGRVDKAAQVIARLAHMLYTRDAQGEPEAQRLVERGLAWNPNDPALLALERSLESRPTTQDTVVEHIMPLDLSDLVEVTLGSSENSRVEVEPEQIFELELDPEPENEVESEVVGEIVVTASDHNEYE